MPTICDYSNTLKLEIQKFQKTVSILRLFKMEMRWKDWIVHVSITTVRALVYCAIVVSMQCMKICQKYLSKWPNRACAGGSEWCNV